MDAKVKNTVKTMFIGTAIYEIVLLILIIIFTLVYCNIKRIDSVCFLILKNIIAVILGFVCSIISVYSMAVVLSKSLDTNDPSYVKRRVVISSVIRNIIYCIILSILINDKVFGFMGGIIFAIALLGIKIGAYLTPIIQNKFVR